MEKLLPLIGSASELIGHAALIVLCALIGLGAFAGILALIWFARNVPL